MSILSIELTPDLDAQLEALALGRRADKAAVAREMIEFGLARVPVVAPPEAGTDPGREEPPSRRGPRRVPTPGSALELAGDLVGSVEGPGDLSTNPKYMEGFGR